MSGFVVRAGYYIEDRVLQWETKKPGSSEPGLFMNQGRFRRLAEPGLQQLGQLAFGEPAFGVSCEHR